MALPARDYESPRIRRLGAVALGLALANEAERRRRRQERLKLLVAYGFCLAALVYIVIHVALAITGGQLPG